MVLVGYMSAMRAVWSTYDSGGSLAVTLSTYSRAVLLDLKIRVGACCSLCVLPKHGPRMVSVANKGVVESMT